MYISVVYTLYSIQCTLVSCVHCTVYISVVCMLYSAHRFSVYVVQCTLLSKTLKCKHCVLLAYALIVHFAMYTIQCYAVYTLYTTRCTLYNMYPLDNKYLIIESRLYNIQESSGTGRFDLSMSRVVIMIIACRSFPPSLPPSLPLSLFLLSKLKGPPVKRWADQVAR